VEVFFGNFLDGREPVDTRVIDEDIQSAELLDRRVDDGLRVARPGNVAANGDSLAPGRDNVRDDCIRARFAGRVIDDY